MIKKIYGLTDKGEQVELTFTKFLMITDNDSHLTIDASTQKHPESPDLLLHIDAGKAIQNESHRNNDHQYFSVLPGAANTIFVKVVRKNSMK